MNRREALNRVALLLGGTLISAELFLSACHSAAEEVADLFNEEYRELLDEMADTMLPRTDTPGAKDARVGQFIAVMLRDCYDENHQQIFLKGLNNVDDRTQEKFGSRFVKAETQQRTAVLTEFEQAVRSHQATEKPSDAVQFYKMMKELTLLGYFTSKLGCTKALRYLPVPGRYDGDYPYGWGDKAWAIS